MRRREPRREEIGGLVANFRIGAELPGAVVDVVEIIEDLGLGPARLPDRGAGRHAAAHWTRVDPARLPRRRDAPRESICLGATAVCQFQWRDRETARGRCLRRDRVGPGGAWSCSAPCHLVTYTLAR